MSRAPKARPDRRWPAPAASRPASLGRVAVVTPVERDDVVALMRARRHRRERTTTASSTVPGATRSSRSVTSTTTTSPRRPCARAIRPSATGRLERRFARCPPTAGFAALPRGLRDVARRRAQSTKSTSTSAPSRTAAARTTVRIDCAMRPRLPMTASHVAGGDVDLDQRTSAARRPRRPATPSGSSTTALTRYSSTRSSRARRSPRSSSRVDVVVDVGVVDRDVVVDVVEDAARP